MHIHPYFLALKAKSISPLVLENVRIL